MGKHLPGKYDALAKAALFCSQASDYHAEERLLLRLPYAGLLGGGSGRLLRLDGFGGGYGESKWVAW